MLTVAARLIARWFTSTLPGPPGRLRDAARDPALVLRDHAGLAELRLRTGTAAGCSSSRRSRSRSSRRPSSAASSTPGGCARASPTWSSSRATRSTGRCGSRASRAPCTTRRCGCSGGTSRCRRTRPATANRAPDGGAADAPGTLDARDRLRPGADRPDRARRGPQPGRPAARRGLVRAAALGRQRPACARGSSAPSRSCASRACASSRRATSRAAGWNATCTTAASSSSSRSRSACASPPPRRRRAATRSSRGDLQRVLRPARRRPPRTAGAGPRHPPDRAHRRRPALGASRSSVCAATCRWRCTSTSTERLPEVVEETIYFCVSECLANAAKHSGARNCSVAVARADGDRHGRRQGRRPGRRAVEPGGGLEGVRDRVEAVSGARTCARWRGSAPSSS